MRQSTDTVVRVAESFSAHTQAEGNRRLASLPLSGRFLPKIPSSRMDQISARPIEPVTEMNNRWSQVALDALEHPRPSDPFDEIRARPSVFSM